MMFVLVTAGTIIPMAIISLTALAESNQKYTIETDLTLEEIAMIDEGGGGISPGHLKLGTAGKHIVTGMERQA